MSDKLIAFIGPLQSGKTTAAKYLAQHHGFSRHRFAGPLKLMLKIGFGLSDEQVDGSLKEEPTDLLGGQTPRHAMQTLGSEWGRRMIHSDIWVMAWRNTRPAGAIVCDDLRFPNEFEALKGMGGQVIRINRPGHSHTGAHDSEAHVLPHDDEILNEGSQEEFLAKVADFFS